MFVDFNTLADQSRLWIYQSNRKFTTAEESLILQTAKSFCEQWSAHGHPLKTSCEIEHHQFLILAVDEGHEGASGCSIDGSVRILKSLEQQTGIDFFDRSNAAFLFGEEVTLIPLTTLKEAFANGTLRPTSMTFNVLAAHLGAWRSNKTLPVEKTWIARYLPKTSVV